MSWVPLSAALAKMSADRPFIDEWQAHGYLVITPIADRPFIDEWQAHGYLVITPIADRPFIDEWQVY